MRLTRREIGPLTALAAILLISAAWWALALWPLPADGPAWLARTRSVCFGAEPGGLPSSAGWTLLIGEPLAMLGALFAIWRDALLDGLRSLARSMPGRAALAGTSALVLAGLGAAAGVVRATASHATLSVSQPDIRHVERVDRAAPPVRLVDQRGDTLTMSRFGGRPVIVAFAYAHCTTVCPLIVHDALAAQRLAAPRRPAVVVITLDPWRDTPSRLASMAAAWGLGDDAWVVSGSVEDVQRTLDEWEVPRVRDEATGEVGHPALVWIVDGNGRLAYRVPGGAELMAALVERL